MNINIIYYITINFTLKYILSFFVSFFFFYFAFLTISAHRLLVLVNNNKKMNEIKCLISMTNWKLNQRLKLKLKLMEIRVRAEWNENEINVHSRRPTLILFSTRFIVRNINLRTCCVDCSRFILIRYQFLKPPYCDERRPNWSQGECISSLMLLKWCNGWK